MYFLIPAVCAVLIIPVWYMMTRREPADFPAENDGKTPPIRRVFRIMTEEKLWLICAVCLCTGLVKEGIGLWAPVIFLEVLGGRFDLSLVLVILIPLGNFCGIMITNQFLKRSNCEPMKLMIRIFAFLALFALATVIFRSSQPGWLVLLIAAVSGMALGANSILMSYLPLSYSARHIVATLIGIFDSFAYIGAAFSAYGLGRFLDDDALIAVPILWFAAAVIAIVLIALRFFLQKRQLKCIMNE